jgi:hypothetical protein
MGTELTSRERTVYMRLASQCDKFNDFLILNKRGGWTNPESPLRVTGKGIEIVELQQLVKAGLTLS